MLSREQVLVRLRAGAVHLAICTLIALLLVALVFLVWYPAPLDAATGVRRIFLTLLAVDVTIGPLLTFLVFDPRKRSLKFDLAVIALLQVAALSYGIYTVVDARPAYVVFNIDRFDLVLAKDIDPESEKHKPRDQYRQAPIAGPVWVAADLPKDPEERNRILFKAAGGGYDLPQMPEYYLPLPEATSEIKAHIQPIDLLLSLNDFQSSRARALLEPYLAHPDAYGFLPLKGTVDDLAVIVSRASGEVVATLALKPWKA
jgi:hypothetical protein